MKSIENYRSKMAYNAAEVEMLKNYTKSVVERDYTPLVQELKDKMKFANDREKELTERITTIEKEWDVYKNCHDCKKFNAEYREVAMQTEEPFDLSMIGGPSTSRREPEVIVID